MIEALNQFGNAQLVTTKRYYCLFLSLHLDKDCRLFLDFHLMELCDKVIISRSCFGIMPIVHKRKSPTTILFVLYCPSKLKLLYNLKTPPFSLKYCTQK